MAIILLGFERYAVLAPSLLGKADQRKQEMKRQLRKRISVVIRFGAFALCGFISAFLMMTGYESIYNRDLPFVHSLDNVNLRAYETRYDVKKYLGDDQKQVGNFGKPTNVKMPRRSMRFDIVKPIENTTKTGGWLARANTLHMMPLTEPKNGNLGATLLYCRASFRTITENNMPNIGDNIFIDTDRNWRYVYRIISTRALPANEPYILGDSGNKGKLIISCNDQKLGRNYVIEAEQLVVQGVEQ